MSITLSQVYVEPQKALRKNVDLKASLKDEGVRIGYPYCEVYIDSEEKLFRLQKIFEYYGWALEVQDGYYVATQNVENVEL